MDDLISRQAAIDELREHRALYCDNTPDTFSKLSYAEKCRVDELDTAIATLINMPSAQITLEQVKEYCKENGYVVLLSDEYNWLKSLKRKSEEFRWNGGGNY